MPEAEPPDRPDLPPPPKGGSAELMPPTRAEFRGLFEEADESDAGQTHAGKMPRSEMSFLDHLEELRMTILKCICAAIIGMALVGAFFIKFFDALRYPLVRGLGEDVAGKVLISSLDPMGGLMMVINVSLFGGLILALPAIGYFVVRFVAPGLTLRERGMLRPAMTAALILFAAGALGCYFFLLPVGLKVAYEINHWLGLQNVWSAQSYYSLVAWAVFGTGLVFEFPLVLVILQVLGVVEAQTLRGFRRHAIVVILIVGGFIAPSPDISSMLLMAGPMILLFEGSLIVGPWLRRRHLADAARRQDEAGEA